MTSAPEARAAETARDLDLELPPGDPAWDEADALLQAGFLLGSRRGISARDFMREALGLEDDYIESVVSTVFVDSQPVDDIDAALLGLGSLIALSAAMPGLVGAVMRRKSPYASFREAISYPARPGAAGGGRGPEAQGGEAILVRVKLFNSVMRDRGRALFARGILVEPELAAGLLARAPGNAGAQGGEGAAPLVRLRISAREEGRT